MDDRRAVLKSLYVEIISACNQKCIYCYNEGILAEHEALPLSVIRRLMKSSRDAHAENFTLSGGEPTLHPEFFEILSAAKEYGLNVSVISNLTTLDDEMAEKIAFYQPDIQITVDSGDPAVHDRSRGRGTLRRQEESLRMLESHGYRGRIFCRCNLWRGNCSTDTVDSIIEFSQKYKIAQVGFAPARATDYWREEMDDMDAKRRVLRYIAEQREKFPRIKPLDDKKSELALGCPFTVSGREVEFAFRIAPNGDVFPCQLFYQKEYSLGNVYLKSIEEILTGEAMKRFLMFMELRPHFIPGCQDCIGQSICSGGCPAEALRTAGSVLKPGLVCEERRRLYRKLLQEKLKETKDK